jgi:hypothetical protein
MSLVRAPLQYDREDQDRLRTTLDGQEAANRKKGQDVEIAGAERLILASPNGSRFEVVVSNGGALSAAAL